MRVDLPQSGIRRVRGMNVEINGDNNEKGVPTSVMICAPVE